MNQTSTVARLERGTEKLIGRLADRIQTDASGFSRWCDGHPLLLISLFSLFHFAALLVVAHLKQFWFDELFTYYIALLPAPRDIFTVLGEAVDHHPPAYFLLTRFVAGLFSDPHIGFRIPSIVGFWILCVSLYVFVSRRSSALFGLLAAVLAHISGARLWATEARPYGLAVGLGAVALLAWQSAAEKRKRTAWLITLTLALAAATSTSYYSVLLLIPLGAAEAVRTMRLGKADLPVWFSLAAGAASGIPYLPAVTRSVDTFNPNNWAKPKATTVLSIYTTFFGDLLPFLLGALMAVAFLLVFRRWVALRRDAGGETQLPPEELVMCLVLLLLPAIGMAAAFAGVKMITARYVISTATGLCILLPLLTHHLSRGRAAVGVALFAVAVLSLAPAYGVGERRAILERKDGVASIISLVGRVPKAVAADPPIVFDDALRMFEACHYAGRRLASRFLLLTNPEASLKYSGVYYSGRGLSLLQRYAPIRVEQYSVFRQNHSRFFYFETEKSTLVFLMSTLQAEGASIRFLAKQGHDAVYLIGGSE